jgi:hypothetical protein
MIRGMTNIARVSRLTRAGLTAAFSLAAALAFGADDKKDAPRITGLVPLEVSPGAEVSMKFRGLKLDTVTEVRFPAFPAVKVEVKESKKADLPTGQEAKDVGDTQCEAAAKLPADLPAGVLAVEVVTPTGVLAREVRVVAAGALAEEKEPNNGFREAQAVSPGKIVRGKIEPEKDVDVFSFTAVKGQRFKIAVWAARSNSMLDPLATVFDEQGRLLRTVDDSEGRDPEFVFQAPGDGRFLIALQDAGDRGGAWHAYELKIEEVAK